MTDLYRQVERHDEICYKWSVINKKGQLIEKTEFSEMRAFKEGLSAVKEWGRKWGFIDKTGAIAIEPQFDG